MKRIVAVCVLGVLSATLPQVAFGQSLGNAGTVEGTVVDPSGAAITNAVISIHNPLTNYSQSTTSGHDGSFRLVNLPPNPYHLEVKAANFVPFEQDVTVRSSLPVQVKASLAVAGGKQTVTVEAAGADMLEVDPSAHVDTDQSILTKLPTIDPGAGLSEAIVYSTGGVAADGNGFFHPLGDHAQVSFNIDGQPISDQQSKVFSTTVANPIYDCVGPSGQEGVVTSKLITLPQGGYDNFPSQENDDHNPDRVQPRNVFDLGIGTDNLTHTERREKFTARVEIANLTNKVAAYNFLSTFSGTHFLQPRMVVARIGFVF